MTAPATLPPIHLTHPVRLQKAAAGRAASLPHCAACGIEASFRLSREAGKKRRRQRCSRLRCGLTCWGVGCVKPKASAASGRLPARWLCRPAMLLLLAERLAQPIAWRHAKRGAPVETAGAALRRPCCSRRPPVHWRASPTEICGSLSGQQTAAPMRALRPTPHCPLGVDRAAMAAIGPPVVELGDATTRQSACPACETGDALLGR